MTGGTGADRFHISVGGGADHITDFSLTLTAGLSYDQLDTSDLQNVDGSPVKAFDVTVSNDGNGNALLWFPGGESVVLKGVPPANVSTSMLHSMGIPCFARGTHILTDQGEMRIEDITPGTGLITKGGPVMPVLWHGLRKLHRRDLFTRQGLCPIRTIVGAFGVQRDLLLSPQHCVLTTHRGEEALVRAQHLAEFVRGARRADGVRQVEYHHLLLPCHALILAEGAWCESPYSGPMATAALGLAARASLARAVYDNAQGLDRTATDPTDLTGVYGPRCLRVLTRPEARDWLAAPPPGMRDSCTAVGSRALGRVAFNRNQNSPQELGVF